MKQLLAIALALAVGACGSSEEEPGGGGEAGTGDAGPGGTAGAGSGATGGEAATGGAGGQGAAGMGGGGTAAVGCGDDCVVCEGDVSVGSQADFDALVAEGCQVVSGTLRIAGTSLTSLDGLAVERIGSDLFVAANMALTSLKGLEGVRAVAGNLNIVNNEALASLAPLDRWPADAVGGALYVVGNTMLPACTVEALDAHLAADCDSCMSNGEGVCP